jgi:hypothetical protein
MNRLYPYGKENGSIHFESVHDGSDCSGNTGIIINFNLIINKDTDVEKVKEIIRGMVFLQPKKGIINE